ncbi:aquaporin [Mycobacterium sp. NPDC003449]
MTAIALRPSRSTDGAQRAWGRYAVEAIGMFCLLSVVGLAVSSADPSALILGAVVVAMMYAGGQFSGGHFNPAITLAALLRGRVAVPVALGCWAAQLGAVAGAAVVWRLAVDPGRLSVALSTMLSGPLPAAAVIAGLLLAFVGGYVLIGAEPAEPAAADLAVGVALLVAAGTVAALVNGVLNTSGRLEVFSCSTVGLYLVSQIIAGAFAGIAFLVDAVR